MQATDLFIGPGGVRQQLTVRIVHECHLPFVNFKKSPQWSLDRLFPIVKRCAYYIVYTFINSSSQA